ncbi:MAG: hypothetical protein H6739_38835 [Alphaproteobacteria bacterium]|nr:hypothetical protein [Alphaproteobacteria bacterium]
MTRYIPAISLALLIACDGNSVKIDLGDTGDDGGVVPEDPDDLDGDGFSTDEDCDDTDDTINPDAEDGQDGVDNDCDGYTDEIDVCEGAHEVIQDAVDEAPDGGVVLICPGTYAENLDLSGREVTLIGLEGAAETVVEAAEAGSPVITVGSRAEVVIEGLTITGGVATSGGGVYCDDAELTLTTSLIGGNTAETHGGGLAGDDCDITLELSVVTANTAGGRGGGLYLEGSHGAVSNSLIEGNVGDEGGGLFIYNGDVDVVDNEIRGNDALTTDEELWGAGSGGGGLWMGANSLVRGNVIAENHTGYNGGGAFFYRGSPSVDANEVLDNRCDEDGAGLYFNYANAQITDNLIEGNEAADDAGGLRLYVGNSTITGNQILNNVANDDGGGAKLSHSHHTFVNNHIEGNRTGDAGGGLELDNDSTAVTDSTFLNNQAYRGGGLHNWRTERSFTISDSHFEGNTAGDCGGALAFDNNPYRVTLENLTIQDNNADDGAGICTELVYRDPEDVGGQEDYYQRSVLRLRNLAFIDNNASDDGGVAYVKAGDVDMANVVMVDNEGPGAAAIAAKLEGVVVVNNAILSGNSGGPLFLLEDDGEIGIRYSDIFDYSSIGSTVSNPIGVDGNISDDPLFTSGFELDPSSPCVDAGDPNIRDQDGSRSDMGLHGGPDAP